jgi:hypothetical protein
VRIVRSVPTEEDVKWAGDESRLLVVWPVAAKPRGASARATPDTIGGVVADSALVVAGFPRAWRFTADSLRGGLVVARWVDGEPAAVEWPEGRGCIRSVAISVNPVGDLPIRNDFVRLVRTLSAGCSTARPSRAMPQASLAALEGKGGLAPRDAFSPGADVRSSLAPWLFGVALVAALLELVVRRRKDEAVVAESRATTQAGKAA